MDIEKLKALKVIVETGSITRAAERLGYSQPGLTGMLNRLEQEIGYPVLQRGSGGVSLTEAGEALMPHVERILQDSRALEQAIADHRPEERRILRQMQTEGAEVYVQVVYAEAKTPLSKYL